jgi:predicted amidohydrolase YtcJ
LAEVTLEADSRVKTARHLVAFRDLGPAPASSRDPWLHAGLFDSHLHLTWIGEIERRVVATSFNDAPAYVRALREKLSATPAEETLISYGFDEDRWNLNKQDLCERVGAQLDPQRKWLLFRVCGHSACASPALLKEAGLDDTRTLIDDTAIHALMAHLPSPTRARLKQDFLRGQELMLEAGITAVGDMSLDHALIPAVKELRDEGRLELDYQGVMIDESGRGAYLEAPIFDAKNGRHFEIRHWKRYLDGSFGSRTAWLREPYDDDAGTKGLRLYETSELIASARAALEKGFALSFHAIGDAALEQLLDMSDALAETMRRMNEVAGFCVHRIEHAQMMGDDQLARLKKLGLWTLCVQPYHRVADGGFIVKRLGRERFERNAYRLGELVAAGLPVSLGSDAPITFYEPAKTLGAAHTLSFEEALWRFSDGARRLHGLAPTKLELGARVWLLEPRATSL